VVISNSRPVAEKHVCRRPDAAPSVNGRLGRRARCTFTFSTFRDFELPKKRSSSAQVRWLLNSNPNKGKKAGQRQHILLDFLWRLITQLHRALHLHTLTHLVVTHRRLAYCCCVLYANVSPFPPDSLDRTASVNNCSL
jgi:hypothetical protein